MKPYPRDLRTRMAAACQESGAKKAAVVRRVGVGRPFVKALRREAATGSLSLKLAMGEREHHLDATAQA